jgi:hypothetical protein
VQRRQRRQLFQIDRMQRKNKLDTGEDKTSQRMRRNQKIRTDCWSYFEVKQSKKKREERGGGERGRKQARLNQSLWRGVLSQNSSVELNQTSSSERSRKHSRPR